jgi:uncharacterized repeat protein (TIGR01451 family)
MKRFSLELFVLASVLFCAFSVQADLNDGLVAYYPLNGNANDESGNGNNGIEFGGISYSNGKEGLAANFDGIDDYIKADADNLPTAERTISLWFYANKIEMPRPVPFAYGGVSCGESWFMMLSPEPEPPFYLSGHCHSYDAYGPWYLPPVGAWYHWVITTSSEGTKFFINGIEVAYHNMFINNTFVENKDLAIGVDVSPTGYAPYTDTNVGWFNGLIDEVRVYNRALSTEEILDLTGFKITSSSKLSVQLGVFTSIQFEAKKGIAPFVWSIVDGTLPPGMNFSPDGILSGSPTQSGEFSYDILVSDSDSDPNVAEKHFTLEVVLNQPPPNIRLFKTGSIPVPGRKLDYFILVENIGTVSASEVKVLEVLDPTEDFKFVSTNPQPLFINDFMSRWSVTSLSPGEIQVLSYSVELSPSVQIGATVYGKAVVLCEECQASAECLFYSANCESEPPLPYCNEMAAKNCRDVCEETCGAGSSSTHAAPAQGALDPNEKLVIARQYIQPEQLLVYPIHFENIGTIEARDIFITDILDENLDLSTLEILTPDGGSFDPTTRTLNWKLLNRDLLPGETGSVLYSIKALPGLPSGTEIRNKATIQFEVFEPFTTNEVLNIIDAVRPKGIMDSLPEISSTLEIPISWRGTDEVGEIEYYSILVSVNGGSFSVLLDKTKDKSTIFTGVEGHTYGFICIATDTAGNTEIKDPIPETVTKVISQNINDCEGDFEPDGDVDGLDLFHFVMGQVDINLDDFIGEFGRINCP